ncbi:hypothetical protein BD626DRAFT_496868 [Schizophyllum amplum]|uniref:Uncharacterized protein n=1 Tax=Schizophyllum amplum TaxID=97359 RepID=A0A550CDM1_9AGAR|nr:hypothetical protein BD626DRAFT_496868 [Auriculariopsis ampla]
MQQIYKDWWQKNKIEPAQRAQAESRNDNIVAQQASASLSASDHGGQPSFDASTQAAHSLHRSRIPHPLLFRQPSPVTTPPIATAASSTYSSGPPSGAYTWSHIYRPAPPSASASACSSRQPSVSSSTASTSAWYPVDQGGPSPLSSATYSSRHASMSSTSSVHPPSRSAWPNSDAACTYEPPPVPPSSYHSVVRTFDGQDSPFGANPDAQAGNLAASFVDAQSQYDNSVTEVPSRLLLHPEVQQALRRAAAEIPSTLQHRPEYLEPSRIHGWPPGSSPPPGVPVTPEHPQSLGRYAVPQGQPQSSMPVSMGDGYMVGNYTVAPNMGASNPPGDQWLRPAIDVGTADAYAEDIYGDAPIFDMDDSPSYDPSSALAMLYSEADPNDLAAWVMSLPPMDMRRLDDPSVWDNSESWQ